MPNSTTPYHHGALREALIQATEALLAERGADGFSLREVARRAGVSPAAPSHHFGDGAGLLTAVATLGFEGLTQALEAADARGGADPAAALLEQGVAYVDFALRHPGRFRLMFRSGQLHGDPELARCSGMAFEVLARGVRRAFGVADAGHMTPEHWNAVTALWSVVHGYSHLAIAGKFEALAGPGGVPAFVQRSLRPILEANLRGLLGPPSTRAVSSRRSGPRR